MAPVLPAYCLRGPLSREAASPWGMGSGLPRRPSCPAATCSSLWDPNPRGDPTPASALRLSGAARTEPNATIMVRSWASPSHAGARPGTEEIRLSGRDRDGPGESGPGAGSIQELRQSCLYFPCFPSWGLADHGEWPLSGQTSPYTEKHSLRSKAVHPEPMHSPRWGSSPGHEPRLSSPQSRDQTVSPPPLGQ